MYLKNIILHCLVFIKSDLNSHVSSGYHVGQCSSTTRPHYSTSCTEETSRDSHLHHLDPLVSTLVAVPPRRISITLYSLMAFPDTWISSVNGACLQNTSLRMAHCLTFYHFSRGRLLVVLTRCQVWICSHRSHVDSFAHMPIPCSSGQDRSSIFDPFYRTENFLMGVWIENGARMDRIRDHDAFCVTPRKWALHWATKLLAFTSSS